MRILCSTLNGSELEGEMIGGDRCDEVSGEVDFAETFTATIMGFEVMCALRKDQAALFNLTHDSRGKARIVERAFGIGMSALAEAIAVIGQTLNSQPACCLR